MTKQDERREYRRVTDEFSVRIAREMSNKNFRDVSIDVGRSVNISASGILLSIEEKVDVDETCRVTFLKPNTFEFFESLARVVRVSSNDNSSFEVALHFIDLSEEEKKRLNYYVMLLEK